jgi:sterol desaturase/sphingolipid hydroxylase (fatty acid hydroxylase superfamily)
VSYLDWLILISALFVGLERLWPRVARARPRPGWLTDLSWLLFNGHLLGALAAWLGAPLVAAVEPLLPWRAVASGWPAPAQLALALVGVDLLHWGVHNLLHRVPWLWELHRVHHSIEDLDWIGSFRFHWAEGLLYKAVTYPVLATFGFSSEVLMTLAVANTAMGHFNHSNLAVSLGPLRYVLNSPAMHAWHHAAPGEAPLCNFGITLSLWDWLFGTAYLPDRPPERLGLGEPFPRTFLAQALHPCSRCSAVPPLASPPRASGSRSSPGSPG